MKSWLRAETGQTLVQVTLMLVVLLGFIALAIDVGMAYAERRHMQNAADAGALAGARELCLSGDPVQAEARARAYAVEQNGALSADVAIDGGIVSVVAHINAPTFLAGVVGVSDIAVSADAAAACGAANAACGLWPIAFSLSAWEEFYSPDGEVCKPQRIIVWNDENQALPDCSNKWPAGEPCTCKDKDTGVVTDDLCRCYDCDTDNDGDDDFSMVRTEGRAWLDLSETVLPFSDSCTQPGCGEAELECHIRNNSAAQVRLPSCIAGDNGVKAGVKDGVNSRTGDPVSIALYDSLGCSAGICPGGQTYRVTRFGCINVGGWDHAYQVQPYNTLLYDRIQGKVIVAYVNCDNDCSTACGTTDGTPPEPWEVTAVNLLR